MHKQFSPACDRNKDSILEILRPLLKDKSMIFEIGTGTGQHAVFFSKNLSHLQWQTSDLIHNHANIKMWLEEAKLSNMLSPESIITNVKTEKKDPNHAPFPEADYIRKVRDTIDLIFLGI